MIIAGEFLSNILGHFISVSPDIYGVIFALAWSILVMVRLKTVAAVDLVMMGLFGATVTLLMIFSLPHVQFAHLTGFTPGYWFLPYGVIMFALSGANAVPIQRQLLVGREKLLRPAIITAVALVTLLYGAFAFMVVGVSGGATSPEAIAGLAGVVGSGVIFFGSLFGLMTISTSFLMISTTLYETFRLDYRLGSLGSWLLVIMPPLVFFWSGFRNFVDVIGLIGSVAVGILTIIILAAYKKAKKISLRTPEFTIVVPSAVTWAMILIFSAGIAYSLLVR